MGPDVGLLEEGFDQGGEALRRFPKGHVPRGGNYNSICVREYIRIRAGNRQRERIAVSINDERRCRKATERKSA
jgi:hypothetical protein